MKKHDAVLLCGIACITIWLGMKLADSLEPDVQNLEIRNSLGFENRLAAFVSKGEVTQEGDKDVVYSEAQDLYLSAQQWEWYPDIEINAGREYRLHIASLDIQHSFHLEKDATGKPIDILIQPGKEYVIILKNMLSGVYAIGCTEYCGIEHNKMRGKLIVR